MSESGCVSEDQGHDDRNAFVSPYFLFSVAGIDAIQHAHHGVEIKSFTLAYRVSVIGGALQYFRDDGFAHDLEWLTAAHRQQLRLAAFFELV